LNGSAAVTPASTPSTFTLTCTGPGGSQSANSTVTVTLPMDPVASSVADSTLAGTVSNNNGVRDDLAAYITQRYPDAQKQAVGMNYAKAATGYLLAASAGALTANTSLEAAAVCGYNEFGLAAFRTERVALLAALLNNSARLSAWYANHALLDGAVLPDMQSLNCNLDGSAYNGTP
jgi:hypothetical protein